MSERFELKLQNFEIIFLNFIANRLKNKYKLKTKLRGL
jgi:hypothetical protein